MGRPYSAKVATQRKGLDARIGREGFGPVMEAAAYTWFNRFAALRYMEVHGYLEHGFRVLSNPNGGVIPEILEQAANVTLLGLDRDKVNSFTWARTLPACSLLSTSSLGLQKHAGSVLTFLRKFIRLVIGMIAEARWKRAYLRFTLRRHRSSFIAEARWKRAYPEISDAH